MWCLYRSGKYVRQIWKSHIELSVVPKRADDYYPGVQEQEKFFLSAVSVREDVHLDTVRTISELIKWYLGPMKRNTGEPDKEPLDKLKVLNTTGYGIHPNQNIYGYHKVNTRADLYVPLSITHEHHPSISTSDKPYSPVDKLPPDKITLSSSI